MNTKNTNKILQIDQRAELHKQIWNIANQTRGSIDGWDFKQYILGFLFYRFISEDLTNYFNQNENAINPDELFDYADISDEEAAIDFKKDAIKEKGFYIQPSHLFQNVAKHASNNENLNIDLINIFKAIQESALGADSETKFKGLFDDIDISRENSKLGNTVKEKNLLLTKIIDGISNFQLHQNGVSDIDLFGDAYEYLISQYASNAGKRGGEHFTPQCVSSLLCKLAIVNKNKVEKIYDPTCGSGSLLLRMKRELAEHPVISQYSDAEYHGQEINGTSYNLCRMNMFLHGVNYSKFDIQKGNTLTNSLVKANHFFDVIVSNPPYSIQWVGENDPTLIHDDRFSAVGVLAPKNKADFAFVLHALHYLHPKGTAAIVCFPGIFYRRGKELTIRKYLIQQNNIAAIIQLPDNLFYGTSISTCVLVLAKNKESSKVLFIDASQEFKKETNNNMMTEEHIMKIVDTFTHKKEIPHFSRYVDVNEIAEKEYNLSVNNYVQKVDTREKIDIKVLNAKIDETVTKIDQLRAEINKIIATIEADLAE